LFLSSQKIGRSYPLIADAPSSVFDAENTQMYTKKIGEKFSFEKKIIQKELAAAGIQSILTSPQQLSVNTINKYLELKARGMI
jgi:hypothetical protein